MPKVAEAHRAEHRSCELRGWGESLVNPPSSESIQGVLNHYLAALTEIVRRAQALGQLFPSFDAPSFGRILLSLYCGAQLRKALDNDVDIAAYGETAATWLLAGTLHP